MVRQQLEYIKKIIKLADETRINGSPSGTYNLIYAFSIKPLLEQHLNSQPGIEISKHQYN